MENAPIIKEDGAKQRIDVALNKPIAEALAALIFAGKTLYPRKGGLKLVVKEGETEKAIEIGAGTLTTWITRENVIPETGETLRAYLDGKRAEKRLEDEQARQDMIREGAEKQLVALTGLAVKPKEVTKIYKIHEGRKVLARVIEVEGSPKMNEVISKGLQFGLERLQPQRYGAKVEQTHTHLIFDFARLRKARRAKVEAQVREALPQ